MICVRTLARLVVLERLRALALVAARWSVVAAFGLLFGWSFAEWCCQ